MMRAKLNDDAAPAARGDAEHRSEDRGDHHARDRALAARALRDRRRRCSRISRTPRRVVLARSDRRARQPLCSTASTCRARSSCRASSCSSSARSSSSRCMSGARRRRGTARHRRRRADVVEREGTEHARTARRLNLAWLLLCAFLVMFMQLGFAMVETGFTRVEERGPHDGDEPRHLPRRGPRLLAGRVRARDGRRRRAGARSAAIDATHLELGVHVGPALLRASSAATKFALVERRARPREPRDVPLLGGLHGHGRDDPDRARSPSAGSSRRSSSTASSCRPSSIRSTRTGSGAAAGSPSLGHELRPRPRRTSTSRGRRSCT